MKKNYLFLLTSLFGLLAACSDKKEVVTPVTNTTETPLVATINQEQQANNTTLTPTNSPAIGTFTGTYNSNTKQLTYRVEYSGFVTTAGAPAPATSAHIHTITPGFLSGPVTIPFSPLTSPIIGTYLLTPEQADDLLNGHMYVNIHTARFPGGEIRGNIRKL